MIDASKFAKPIIGKYHDTKFFRFGVGENAAMAQEIRRFADLVESGSVIMQKVESGAAANIDDYAMYGLYFEFAVTEDREVEK